MNQLSIIACLPANKQDTQHIYEPLCSKAYQFPWRSLLEQSHKTFSIKMAAAVVVINTCVKFNKVVNCARIIVASTFRTFSILFYSYHHCIFVACWPNINFILTAAVCNQRSSRTWPSGILRFLQYSYKMEVVSYVSFILNS